MNEHDEYFWTGFRDGAYIGIWRWLRMIRWRYHFFAKKRTTYQERYVDGWYEGNLRRHSLLKQKS